MELITSDPTIERIFGAWRVMLGPHYETYRGHVYRMFNYTLALLEPRFDDAAASAYGGWQGARTSVAVAAAFHDVGVFTDKSMDYLEPSVLRAKLWLERKGAAADFEVVAALIRNHHKLTPYRKDHAVVVEPFRRADLADLSAGWIKAGVPKDLIHQATAAFPYAGFQPYIAKRVITYMLRHPLRPLPMMRA